MKEWFVKFWNEHGERLIYCGLVVTMAVGFALSGTEELSNSYPTLLIAVATLFLNKARGKTIENTKQGEPE